MFTHLTSLQNEEIGTDKLGISDNQYVYRSNNTTSQS